MANENKTIELYGNTAIYGDGRYVTFGNFFGYNLAPPENVGCFNSKIFLEDFGLTKLPNSWLPNGMGNIHSVRNNKLCNKYYYYLVGKDSNFSTQQFYPQDQSNCCEGVNYNGEIDPNWTQCAE